MTMTEKNINLFVVITLACVNAVFIFLAIYLPIAAAMKNKDSDTIISQSECDDAASTVVVVAKANVPRSRIAVSCGTTLCDAPYCTTASVRDNVPALIYQTEPTNQTASECTNPDESTVAAMCTANTNTNTKWINHKECLAFTNAEGLPVNISVNLDGVQTTRLITGTLNNPVLNKLDVCVIYYFSIYNGTDVVVTGVCDTVCDEAAPEPAQTTPFAIHLSLPVNDSSSVTGVYTLEIKGAPAWDPSTILYTVARTPLNLHPAFNPPGVSATLNPVSDPNAAIDMANSYKYSILPSQNKQLVITQCPPYVCTLDDKQSLYQKMIIVAWQKVPVPETLPPSSITPVSADTYVYYHDTATINYVLQRSGVQLLYEKYQETLVFFDVAPLNTNVFYTLTAQLRDLDDNVLCESEPQYFSTNTQGFTASECAQFKRPPVAYPPNMWLDNLSDGMCIWDNNVMAAKDLVCLADSLVQANNYSLGNIKLFDVPSGACRAVGKQFPSTSETADFVFKDLHITAQEDPQCKTGRREQAQVSCMKTVALDETETSTRLTFEDLSARLNNAVAFHEAHPFFVNPSGDTQLTAVLNLCKDVKNEWSTVYNVCGPATNPRWGLDKNECSSHPGDSACLQYADAAACAVNKCDGEWKVLADSDTVTTYIMEQTTFQKSAPNSVCCHNSGTYSVDAEHTPSCACNEGNTGEWCDLNPCLNIVCNGSGTCKLDDNNNPYCECKEHYHNVAKVLEDYQLHGDECTTDGKTWTCTCPRMCGKDEQWSETNKCVKYEPLMCNQNKCVSTNLKRCDDELSRCNMCTSAARMTHEVSRNIMFCVAH